MPSYEFVILGGGVAAGYAAQTLVEHEIEPDLLCIVSADNMMPYDRPPLSKGHLMGEKALTDILINDPVFYEEHGIAVLLNTRVASVDLEGRALITDQGDTIQFGKLLITTGSRLRTLDVPGGDLPGIHYLRSADDSLAIKQAMASGQQAVVIGAGYIGMEVSSVLARKDIAVTMVFPEDRVMERFFTPEMSAFFQRYYEARGVTLMPGNTATGFKGERRVSGVVLESGQELPADFVVAGIGVVPAIELFEGSDLHTDSGIVVNKYLETNLPEIYAAGDVAEYYDVIFQKHRRIEHWDNAVQQGQHAARMMLGYHKEFMYVPYFFSDVFDLSYEFWGDTDGANQVVYRGDVNSGSFSAWWLIDDLVVAAFVMGRPDDERELAPEWIRMRRRVPAALLEDLSQPLAELAKQVI